MASAVGIAARRVALDQASLERDSDVGHLSGEFAVALVESFQCGGHRIRKSFEKWHRVPTLSATTQR